LNRHGSSFQFGPAGLCKPLSKSPPPINIAIGR
jgi:hypothetical protein